MKRLLLRLLALIPTKLPQGVSDFETWSDSILDIYNIPNNDSTKFALATTVMHLGSTAGYKSKEYFGRVLIKGAATQVAYQIMQDCKARQAEKAAEEQKQTEATASQETVASDVVQS